MASTRSSAFTFPPPRPTIRPLDLGRARRASLFFGWAYQILFWAVLLLVALHWGKTTMSSAAGHDERGTIPVARSSPVWHAQTAP
jgi:hypothetical protein